MNIYSLYKARHKKYLKMRKHIKYLNRCFVSICTWSNCISIPRNVGSSAQAALHNNGISNIKWLAKYSQIQCKDRAFMFILFLCTGSNSIVFVCSGTTAGTSKTNLHIRRNDYIYIYIYIYIKRFSKRNGEIYKILKCFGV